MVYAYYDALSGEVTTGIYYCFLQLDNLNAIIYWL